MKFERFFLTISYTVVFCGFLSLFVSNGVGIIGALFFALIVLISYFLEGSRIQISGRVGTVLVFAVIPIFYIDRKYQLTGVSGNANELAGMLARMILVLTGIKLLQRKASRDWLFLYLMSFFEVLLAAGLSISPVYLASLIVYLLVSICAIIAFEIRKTQDSLKLSQVIKLSDNSKLEITPRFRLSLAAISLLVSIIILAAPLFFALPRVGGAGLGTDSKIGSSITGFSDSVSLGEIGQLLQNDEIVMRARLENADNKNAGILHWRGVALDSFDNKRWSKSKKNFKETFVKLERGYFLIDNLSAGATPVNQTIYLEPIDSPVLFTLSRAFAIEGSFQNEINKDSENAITFSRNNFERVTYKVYSDRTLPSENKLRFDNENYSRESTRYLQFPEDIDERISQLASEITKNQNNRFDKAKAIETYLQTQFGYSMEMKAKGEQPLADFLFNVREGHCEYFASAMAIMLRTQGIGTRVVNGFQRGEYNETADVFVVRQKDAHSWVEVYFPKENVWVPFDPTPAAGRFDDSLVTSGILGQFNNYLVALETFWIQYFVSYDNQEQRSLMRSFRNSFVEYKAKTSIWLNDFQDRAAEWWRELRGDKGWQTSLIAIAYGTIYILSAVLVILLIILSYRKLKHVKLLEKIRLWIKFRNQPTIVEFYERMQKILASKGFKRAAHQTPLEFAFALNMNEAVRITEKYNRVRFGEKDLTKKEAQEIENWLESIKEKSNTKSNRN